MNNTWYYVRVMAQLFCKDMYVFSYNWQKFAVNYVIVTPITTIVSFGYLFTHIAMHHPTPYAITNFIVGNNLWPLFLIAFSLNIGLLFDIYGERVIDYQVTVIKPALLIVERALFVAIISCINLLPFYPLAKLILGQTFVITHISWLQVMTILALGSLFCSIYTIFFAFFARGIGAIGNLFMRMNYPLIQLGGSFIPWHVMNAYSPLIGRLTYVNPMLYITEGFRQAILGGTQFFSFSMCVCALLIFSGIFLMLALYFFKRKLDHV